MGGASLQIASEYNNGVAPPGGDNCSTFSVVLFGQKYSLYACSYLCYGRDRAESRLLDYLINIQPNVSVSHAFVIAGFILRHYKRHP